MGEEINYGELFGVDGSSETSSQTETDAGVNEQEATEPAEVNENGETESDVAEGAEADGAADGEKAVQSKEENARYAAARRKAEAERDAAIAKAKTEAQADAQKVIDEAYRDMGLTNPYTKKPITTKAEYDAYKQQRDIEQKAAFIKKAGMTDEEFQSFVANLPEVKAASEKLAAAEEAQRAARETEAKARIDAQIKEIGAMDPSIKSVADLKKMENYDRFYQLVKIGNSFVDAYKLANMERLTAASVNASKQAALNSVASKQHLSATSTRGQGSVSVPAAVLEQYRAFNPKATDAEIARHYNAYVKK